MWLGEVMERVILDHFERVTIVHIIHILQPSARLVLFCIKKARFKKKHMMVLEMQPKQL